MHATHSKPLEECDPWPEMENINGVWKNKAYHTSPSIFHFNGGGKIHHLEMEKAMWYKRGQGTNKEILKDMRMIVGDGEGRDATLGELCPNYF